MTEKEKNDYFYVCSLIEYIGRRTKNHRSTVVLCLGKEGVKKQLHDAEMNHCLSFEQVCDEVVDQYHIQQGNFDTITDCKYTVPSFQDIGKLYCILVEEIAAEGDEMEGLISVFLSFISDEISNFETGIYYENPSYLEKSYRAGYLLD